MAWLWICLLVLWLALLIAVLIWLHGLADVEEELGDLASDIRLAQCWEEVTHD